jgi:CheY-like chemotaxis protein
MSLILAVDDEPDILLTIRVILRTCGHEVLEASSGEMALDILKDMNPDAVVLDIRLPGLDGVTVLERLRDASRLSTLPVIMLSAYTNPSIIQRATELGCKAFVEKPFLPEDLTRTLDEILKAGTSPAA